MGKLGYKIAQFMSDRHGMDQLSRDRKNYRYFKCPCCKQVQKAPKGRGRIRVTCHKCGNVFEKKV